MIFNSFTDFFFRTTVLDQRKKNCLFPSERPGEIFFPTMRPVNFYETTSELKKILNRKRKLKKKKEKWDQLKKKNAWSFFFVNFLYLHLYFSVLTDVIMYVLVNMFTQPLNLCSFVELDISRNCLYLSYFYC